MGDEASSGSILRCFIPLKPISMNSLYQVIFSQRRTQLKPEARFWKTQAKAHIPSVTIEPSIPLSLSMDFHDDWYYLNGKIRRIDSPNLIKLTIDAIAEKLGIDDSVLWHVCHKKVQDKQRVGIGIELRLMENEL